MPFSLGMSRVDRFLDPTIADQNPACEVVAYFCGLAIRELRG
jgi:hypothetical protein